jgi:redox-sensitive bicupin YhaK (pirin superfamily)
VSWLFAGEVEHRDSAGNHAMVRPDELNLMTGGHGVSHSEVSTPGTTVLHGVQLWVALPDGVRDSTPADFTHLADLPRFGGDGAEVTVMVGSLGGHTSPAPTYTPLVGAEVRLEAGAEVTLPVEPGFEYGVLAVGDTVEVQGNAIEHQQMAFVGEGHRTLTLRAPGEAAIALLLGGEPFDEEIVMWWNFIGRSHEEVVEQREAWNAGGLGGVPERFGAVGGFDGDRLLAPPLPNTRLKPRGRTHS